MKILYILVILFICYSCEKKDDYYTDNITLTPNNQYKGLSIKEKNFYVYDKITEKLVTSQVLEENSRNLTLSLPKGKYQIIGVGNATLEQSKMQNYSEALIEASVNGNSCICISESSIEVDADSKNRMYSYSFTPIAGSLRIEQSPDFDLYAKNYAYFTLTFERTDAPEYNLKTRKYTEGVNSIQSEPIYLKNISEEKQYIPTYDFFLFPTEKDRIVNLTITLYDANHKITDQWFFEEPIPIATGMITTAQINFSATTTPQLNISVDKTPIEYINYEIGPDDFIYIENNALRQALKSNFPQAFTSKDEFNTNHPSIINTTELNLSNNKIIDISPIYGYFSNITRLNVSRTSLIGLDLSYFPKLTYLNCYKNYLEELNIEKCPNLDTLICSENGLRKLGLDKTPFLRCLECSLNRFEELNISSSAIEFLDCGENKIKNIIINDCKFLVYLNAAGNKLNSIDVSQCTNLEALTLLNNQLTELNIQNNIKLTHCNCSYNQIHKLVLPDPGSLRRLYCTSNKLESLCVSHLTQLTGLECSTNPLKILDISSCTKLEYIAALQCQLEQFILGNQPLEALYIINLRGIDQKLTDISGLTLDILPILYNLYIPYIARDGINIKNYYFASGIFRSGAFLESEDGSHVRPYAYYIEEQMGNK